MSAARLGFVMVSAMGTASAIGTDGGCRLSVQSYDDLARFVDRHAGELVDGAPVVDIGPLADRRDLVRLTFRAPMIDPALPDDVIGRPAPDVLGVGALLAAAWFGALGAAEWFRDGCDDEPGGFDYVSAQRGAAWWQERGARVGFWDASTCCVMWADGGAS